MFTSKIRHSAVGLGLLAIACLGAASASGFATGSHQTTLPAASGNLGEIIVTAPHDLGEIVVTATHELGDVVVFARRAPFDAPFLAEVIVTAPREVAAVDFERLDALAMAR